MTRLYTPLSLKYILIMLCFLSSPAWCQVIEFQDFGRQDFNEDKDWESVVFELPTSFMSTNFQGPGAFDGARFESLVSFEDAAFHEATFFQGVVFDTMVIFRGAVFNKANFFLSAKFHGPTSFAGARFKDKTDLIYTRYDTLVSFEAASFQAPVDFSNAIFHSNTAFNTTKFLSGVSFENVRFEGPMNWWGTTFGDSVCFQSAHFGSEINFTKVTLPRYLSFQNIQTSDIIDLRGASLDSASLAHNALCYLNLVDAPINNFKLRYDNFRLAVPDSLGPKEFEDLTHIYEDLLKNFQDAGYLISYETLDKEYQEFKFTRDPKGTLTGPALNILNKYWSDYGYDKSRIWYYTIGFYLFFCLINWLTLPYLVHHVYPIEIIVERLRTNKKLRAFRLKNGQYPRLNFHDPNLALFYTAFIFFGFKMSIENLNLGKPYIVYYIFVQYILGLVCLAYLANFVISSNLIGS